MSKNEYDGVFVEELSETESIETIEFVQERAKFAGDFSNLFWISIVALVATVMDSFSILSEFAKCIDIGCSVMIIGIFFSMGKLIKEYKNAAVLQLVTIAIAVAAFILGVNTEDGTGFALVVVIIDAIVSLCAVCSEYQGHAAILSGIDDILAEKWNKLWTWTIIAIFGGIFGGILSGFLSILGVVVIFGVVVISVVVTITKVVYLKKMADLFNDLSAKCESAIKEAAEAEVE